MTTKLSGSLGLGGRSGRRSPLGFGAGGERLDFTKSASTAKWDVIYAITKDILTRDDWTTDQKMDSLEKLNTELLRGDFFNPDRLPDKEDMMNSGGLERKQTPFSGKYETKEERETHLKNFGSKLN